MDALSLLDITFTVTLGQLGQPYLVLVGLQFLAVTYAYLYGTGRSSFYNAYLAATIVGTVLGYALLVYGPQLAVLI